MEVVPRLKNLGIAFQNYVQKGDFDSGLWPYIPKPTLVGLFNSILAGGTEYYHLFLGEAIDPTQWFEVETVTKSPKLVALILREQDYHPPQAPKQIWNWKAIIRAFPQQDVPYEVRIQEVPGETTVPGADFNATFRTTRITIIPDVPTPIYRDSAFTQGYFITLL